VARTEEVSLSAGDISTKSDQGDQTCIFCLSEPEEGLRLMGIFFGIKQPRLRQAIVKLAIELSKLDDEQK
jgi:hypothetical protein